MEVATEIIVTVLLALVIPVIIDLILIKSFEKSKKATEISEDDKEFLIKNYEKIKKIQNWSFGIPLIILLFIIFNYEKIVGIYSLPHYLLNSDYTYIKLLILLIIFVSYIGYVLTRLINIIFLGNYYGNLSVNYSVSERVDYDKTDIVFNKIVLKPTDKIVKHPYNKLFSPTKIICVFIILIFISMI